MDVKDDTGKGSVSSVILESLQSSQKGDDLSAEDLGWIESCLVTNTKTLETNWTSFEDVSLDTFATAKDGFAGGTEIKIVPTIEEAEDANHPGRTDNDLDAIPIYGDAEANTNDIPIRKRAGILSQFFREDSAKTFRGDPFLPTYSEDERKDEAVDLGLQSSLSADEMNSSAMDIFRVWDLAIPAEEDLIEQLNKAIAETEETAFQSMPLAFDDSTAWKDLKDEPLDNLIAAIADLSLNTESFSYSLCPY